MGKFSVPNLHNVRACDRLPNEMNQTSNRPKDPSRTVNVDIILRVSGVVM